jgi:hypothetical protein
MQKPELMNGPFVSSIRTMWIIAMLCAGISGISIAPAQTMPDTLNGRFLLVFDTSSAMKKRESATRYAIDRLFFAMMNGQLRPGDTIGVWAFDRKLRTGDVPLQHWWPQSAAPISSNIIAYLDHQHYSRSTRFDALVPEINHLVRDSERLTVLIFCDGEGKIKGTPFDEAINDAFKKNEQDLRSADQVFVVVLRSQFGRYTGYSVNSSAIGVNFPEFPPLPAPPASPAPPKNNPPVEVESNPAPVVHLPPLIIIGTNIGTNMVPAAPKSAPSNSPAAASGLNPPPAAASVASVTNLAPPPVAERQTNAAAPPEEHPSGLSRNGALAIGAALLVAAAALIVFALVRSRTASRGSLISRAMKKH